MRLPSTVRTRRSVTVGNGGATWSHKGIFARTMAGLTANRGKTRTVAVAATYPKEDRAHRTATGSGIEKGGTVARSVDPRAA